MNEIATTNGLIDQKYCSGCAKVIHRDAAFCPGCGAPQGAPRASAPAHPRAHKDRTTAILLALLLGGIGAHKFYLGRVGWGVVYLLTFWTFIPLIVSFIEMIIYITMNEEAFHEKYG